MAIVAISGQYAATATISNGRAFTLNDFFTTDQIAKADTVHISVRSGAAVNYWYAFNAPTVTTTTGHQIPLEGERIFKGALNARYLQFISTGSQSVCAITLGTSGVPR